jgi:chemotaxis methyl-accepting protein methylase
MHRNFLLSCAPAEISHAQAYKAHAQSVQARDPLHIEAASFQAPRYQTAARVRNDVAQSFLSYVDRTQYGYLLFRSRPQLELMRRLTGRKTRGSTLNFAIIGCSIGAEIHSILSTIRAARPDFDVRACAVDNSAEVRKVAQEAAYTSHLCGFVGTSIFERMTEREFAVAPRVLPGSVVN